MAFFKSDGYLYVKYPNLKGKFLVKWRDKYGYSGYILQHINSLNVPKEFVGKTVRIKLEVVE